VHQHLLRFSKNVFYFANTTEKRGIEGARRPKRGGEKTPP